MKCPLFISKSTSRTRNGMTDISELWNCNISLHGPSSLKRAELSTFVNHAEVQHIIKRILLEAPVSKAPSETGTSLTSVGAH